MAEFLLYSVDSIACLQDGTKMLGQLCVANFQTLSNLCSEYAQTHQIETVVSTLKAVSVEIRSYFAPHRFPPN